jgi:glycosyltransferase involved in cell wall biosynthesis
VSAEPRIAIVSDPLVQRGGAERVVESLARIFPDAPIFALLYSAETGPPSLKPRVRASWLNSVPGATRCHRMFLPLYRQAIESFDLSDFDLVFSSHHTVGKGALTRADQVHISYCHTPMRALWERSRAEIATVPAPARPVVAALLSNLRAWDVVTSSRVQHYIANSRATQRRIAAYYRRESSVIPPPIETEFFTPGGSPEDYYLVVSRPVPYKRVDIAIEATARLGRRLKVVGGRHTLPHAPAHVDLLGTVSDQELLTLMRGARALLFPQIEDFGMAPLEMNACGRPVVAYGRGGALDTVIDAETGVLVPAQTAAAFVEGIERFERMQFDPAKLRAHALNFSRDRFDERVHSFVTNVWNARYG